MMSPAATRRGEVATATSEERRLNSFSDSSGPPTMPLPELIVVDAEHRRVGHVVELRQRLRFRLEDALRRPPTESRRGWAERGGSTATRVSISATERSVEPDEFQAVG